MKKPSINTIITYSLLIGAVAFASVQFWQFIQTSRPPVIYTGQVEHSADTIPRGGSLRRETWFRKLRDCEDTEIQIQLIEPGRTHIIERFVGGNEIPDGKIKSVSGNVDIPFPFVGEFDLRSMMVATCQGKAWRIPAPGLPLLIKDQPR